MCLCGKYRSPIILICVLLSHNFFEHLECFHCECRFVIDFPLINCWALSFYWIHVMVQIYHIQYLNFTVTFSQGSFIHFSIYLGFLVVVKLRKNFCLLDRRYYGSWYVTQHVFFCVMTYYLQSNWEAFQFLLFQIQGIWNPFFVCHSYKSI